jgi:hypothetical protein
MIGDRFLKRHFKTSGTFARDRYQLKKTTWSQSPSVECAMRRVQIIEEPDKAYPYAAVDQKSGEIPLRHRDKGDLITLCLRLDWAIVEAGEKRLNARAGHKR